MSDPAPHRPTLLSRRALFFGGGALLLVSGSAWYRRSRPPVWEGSTLDVQAAHRQALDGTITLVDIRTPQEWQATGWGQGARRLDMRREDFVAALLALTGGRRDMPVALICARGVRSARLARQLSAAGFSNIADVPAGMLGSRAGPGWLAEGLPVERGDG